MRAKRPARHAGMHVSAAAGQLCKASACLLVVGIRACAAALHSWALVWHACHKCYANRPPRAHHLPAVSQRAQPSGQAVHVTVRVMRLQTEAYPIKHSCDAMVAWYAWPIAAGS